MDASNLQMVIKVTNGLPSLQSAYGTNPDTSYVEAKDIGQLRDMVIEVVDEWVKAQSVFAKDKVELEQQISVEWNDQKRSALRRAYDNAVQMGHDDLSITVIPEGLLDFDTGYAKYLLEFLDDRLGNSGKICQN